jgi:hypothetical protein
MSEVVILVSGRRAYVWPVLQGSIENLASAGARVTVGCSVAPPAVLVDATPEVNWVPIDANIWTVATLDRSVESSEVETVSEQPDEDESEESVEEQPVEEMHSEANQTRPNQAKAIAGKGVRLAKREVRRVPGRVRRTRRRIKHARRDARRALARTDAVHVMTYRDSAAVWNSVHSNAEVMRSAGVAQLIVAYDLPMIRSAWELGQINTTAGVVLGQAGVDGALTAGMVG